MTEGAWRTAIAYGEAEGVYLRGYDLKDLVGRVSFPEAFLLLARGELPTPAEAAVLEAMMVSVIDHGIVPSSTVTRYLASSGTPIQAAVAGGIMAFGDTYGGAAQQLAEALAAQVPRVRSKDISLGDAGREIVTAFTNEKKRIAGFGHALHPEGDPRVPTLFGLAERHGVYGDYSRLAQSVEAALAEVKGRRIAMNQDGAIAAIGLDLGFNWRMIRALAFVPRAAGLAVHAVEEMMRERGWRHVPDAEVTYDGPPRRAMPAPEDAS